MVEVEEDPAQVMVDQMNLMKSEASENDTHREAKEAYEMSIRYSKGLEGYPLDHAKAVELLRKASAFGHQEAIQVVQAFDSIHGQEAQPPETPISEVTEIVEMKDDNRLAIAML